jgi:hypothetical protein
MTACERCGTRDTTVRGTVFFWVFSIVFASFRRTAAGIWCDRCRRKESLKWTTVSLLVGPWGFPWGPIWTVQAIYRNLFRGGFQTTDTDAFTNSRAAALQREVDASAYEATARRTPPDMPPRV